MRAKLFETEEPLLRRRLRKPRESLARGTHKHLLRVGREHKKAVTRDSIKAAAKQLFSELDYEKATVRAIAARAGVALGTVLRHAEDKRDLILLAYNDDVEATIARAAGVISENVSFDQNLLAFFRVFYESYAANLQLARTYLQINFFAFGMNAKGLAQNRQRKLEAVKKIVRLGQRRRELRQDVKPEMVALQFLFLHSSAVRSWILQERPNIRTGLTEMRRLIELQMQGLNPTPKRRSVASL